MIHDAENHVDNTETSKRLNKAEADRLLGHVAEEFFRRVSCGEQPSIDDYAKRYPEIAELIRDTFAAVQFIDYSIADTSGDRVEETSRKQNIGDFRILREIGRGGMGIVYEAEQLSLGRTVALKVLPYAAMLDQKAITRFKNEARAAATLDHPNIVPVFAVGNERGIYYYAMSLIDGLTAADLISHLQQSIGGPDNSTEPLSIDDCLKIERARRASSSHLEPTVDSGQSTERKTGVSTGRDVETYRDVEAAISTHRSRFDIRFFRSVARLGAQAAEALDHAHQHGIVHRDIKPGNLLIDREAKLWITDFGLARIESDAGITMTGDLIGTLRYMSPEQALAKRIVVDHRADVYALGASLYELLTLRPTFDGANRESLLRQIALEDPKPMRHVNRSVPEDLQTIVHKALSKDPDDRYQSAQDMADDLHAFVNDEPIKARPLSIAKRTARWSGKHKGLMASVAAVWLLLVVGLLVSNAMIRDQRDLAEAAQQKERIARLDADLQREKAERQTLLAKANARAARETVDNYLTKVSEETLLNAESMQPLRKELLQLALSYYQEFTKQQVHDAELIAEHAEAHRRVGRIEELLGDTSAALRNYESELSLRMSLAQLTPNSLDNLEELAITNELIALIYYEVNDFSNRDKYAEQAKATLNKIVVAQPDRVSLNLANAFVNLSGMLSSMNENLAYRRKGIQMLERLAETYPNDPTYRFELARALANGGGPVLQASIVASTVAWGPQKVAALLQEKHRAVAILRRLANANPSDLKYQQSLAVAYANLAVRLGQISRTDEAMDATRKAIETYKCLAERNPDVAAYRLSLSTQHQNLFFEYRERDQWEEALESNQRAVDILEQACNLFPDDEECFHELTSVYHQRGMALLMLGRKDQAKNLFEKQVELCSMRPDAEQHAWILNRMGAAHYHLRHYAESRKAFEALVKSRGETIPTIRGGMKWWYLAMIMAQAGEQEKSRSYFDVLVEETKDRRSADFDVRRFLRSELASILGLPDPAEDELKPSVVNASYERGTGPVVAIDAAHLNLHSLARGAFNYTYLFRHFGEIVAADGYQVLSFSSTLNSESLADVDVMVMGNPQLFDVESRWEEEGNKASESRALVEWVKKGGSLLLVADDEYSVAAIEELSAALGIEWTNDAVTTGADGKRRQIVFERVNGQLAPHPIVMGRLDYENVDQVVTRNGFAFRASQEYQPLLVLQHGAVTHPGGKEQGSDVSGWFQGAAAEIGMGRVVVLGEADIFCGEGEPYSRIGLTSTWAEDHQQFLLNVMHWLSREI